MSQIVNLRMARKRKVRADRSAAAEENRVRHGRTKPERLGEIAERARDKASLDGHRLASPGARDDTPD